MKIAAIVLFALTYVLMIALPRVRHWVALGTAAIFVILGVLPVGEVPGAIDWNVLLMIFGTMLLVEPFIDSKMPNAIAEKLLKWSPNVMWVTIWMSIFSGVVSAFIDNVATVLMVAPVGLAVCKKLNISPVPMILSIAVSSNLQGAATLVGDTTSIMLGAQANMDFLDFFWMDGKPGIFFAVELGALATVPIMMFLFRKDKQKVTSETQTEVRDFAPSVMMVLVVVLLIAASFIPNKPAVTNGVICVVCGLITLGIEAARGNGKVVKEAVKGLDVNTVLLLAGLFLIIGGVKKVGLIDDLANIISKVGGSNLFLLYTVVVWGSVIISAFIDNIPYVATMLPVLAGVASSLGANANLLYFGLLTGATLGGNITPIGASANIAGVGMLRKEGHEVSFKDFTRIGLPFTLAAVTAGYLFIWFVWR